RRPVCHLRLQHPEAINDLVHSIAGKGNHDRPRGTKVGGTDDIARTGPYSGMPRSSAKACRSARIGMPLAGWFRLSSKNWINSPSGSSVSIALTGPIEAGDMEMDRKPRPSNAMAEIGRPASSPHSVTGVLLRLPASA